MIAMYSSTHLGSTLYAFSILIDSTASGAHFSYSNVTFPKALRLFIDMLSKFGDQRAHSPAHYILGLVYACRPMFIAQRTPGVGTGALMLAKGTEMTQRQMFP